MLTKEKSVSNLYIIPAGVVSPSPLGPSSHPAAPSTTLATSRIVTTETPTINSSAAVPPVVVPGATANARASMPEDRSTLNVLRGEPFTINGSVDNRSITRVQVWLLDGTISTTIIPIMPDGTFQVTLDAQKTSALSRNFSSAVLVQYPAPPDHFAVMWNTNGGEAVETENGRTTPVLSHVKDPGLYPTTLVDYLKQGITAAGNSGSVYFLNGVDAWIMIDPVSPSQPGTLVVHGNTSLPVGTSLSITVGTVYGHPTPKNYDWSHEFTDGSAVVYATPGGGNQYSGIINTSQLNTGKYVIIVESRDDNLEANADCLAELVANVPANPEEGNYIDWSLFSLPDLVVNTSLTPVMLEGELRVVPPGTQKTNNEVPYGSVIDCIPDGTCRVFNPSGVQVLVVYNSNEARIIGVPNGAFINESIGNVTFIELNGSVVLTKINEYPRGS